MRQILIFFLSIILLTPNVYADELKIAEFIKCESASEYIIKVDNKINRVKLKNYYNPNTVIKSEIDAYACNVVSTSPKLEVEFTNNKDKYNRELVSIYVYGKSLLENLVINGMGEIGLVSEEDETLNDLCDLEGMAIDKNLGIWKYETEEMFCKNIMNNKVEESNEGNSKKSNKKEIDANTITLITVNSLSILLLCIVLAIRK